MSEKPVRIVHETNPRKYFPALYWLASNGQITVVGEHRYSVVKEWMRSWLRERRTFRERMGNAASDFALRLRIPFLVDETIVLGFAPWDWRILVYGPLARRNRIIYHTSWHEWTADAVPRTYGRLSSACQALWLRFLRHPNTVIVSVTEAGRSELATRYGLPATVIPHSVPEVFFRAGAGAPVRPQSEDDRLRLIYVGELSRKKGVAGLLHQMQSEPPAGVSLTIVGDGPLRSECLAADAAGAVRYVGPITDREQLAHEMAAHDLLVLLSQRTGGWEELFGIVLAEAMAAGLGVLATDHVGPRTLLAEAALGNLFSDGDKVGPWRLIEELAADPGRLQRFKEDHRGLAADYAIDRVAEAWWDLMRRSGPVPENPR